MAEAVLYGISQEVLKNLGSKALGEIASAWGFKDRLEQLKNTINTLKDVLLDAEQRQADSHAVRGWLARLTSVVYAADDLFDEFATVASQRQLLGGNKLKKEVLIFFSSSNQISFAFKVSRKIKTIRQQLDDIVKDGTQFDFMHCSQEEGVVKINGRDQTYSFVDAEEVIGRDADKEVILDWLLTEHEHQNEVLPVMSIVGIGGLGKTTLAKLIHNDPLVKDFFELRLWVCVSEIFDLKTITEKILMSSTNAEILKLEMDQLQGRLQNEIRDKKYLLVLDDVWNENREKWLELKALLKIGRKGSKILVTTRSREVAEIMGAFPHELQGLSEEKSWDLFEKMAFKPGQAQQNLNLVKVGNEIVKKCANVPLAIRTVGSLLYNKDESKWLSFKDSSLAKLSANQNDIMSILKLSYLHLWSPLKNCFAYCALFPKDYKFDKETLIDLWIAEGFVNPSTSESQGLEELAQDYFSTLLQRCFFQDIKKDEWGVIQSCKMHDLMHDLAQEVAGFNFKLAKFGERDLDNRIRHMSFDHQLNSEWKIPSSMFHLKHIRTFLLPTQMMDGLPFSKLVCQQLGSSLRYLRVLDLHSLGIESLPSSVAQLIHLRYLNLSGTLIKELPESITKLQNLQTLNLYCCFRFTRLPSNIRMLTKLRSLDIGGCDKLSHIPLGIGELTSLHKLPRFTVNPEPCLKIKGKPSYANLSDLKNLNGLRGVLWIDILGNLIEPVFQAKEANLTSKHGLTELRIKLAKRTYEDVNRIDHDEAVMESLKPHPNLKKLEICLYRGRKLPSWAMMDKLCSNLPNLVEIRLLDCGRCQQLPTFGQLPFLKRLSLLYLESVEYMEMEGSLRGISSQSGPASMETQFFPSLEELTLINMDNLKGWWTENVEAIADSDTREASHALVKQRLSSMSFSNLSKLRIERCPNLIFLPQCPNVEELEIMDANETISVSKMVTTSPSTSSSSRSSLKLKKLKIGNAEDLISIPKQCLHQLSSLDVRDIRLENLDRLGEVFATTLSSSLRCLEIIDCGSLRSISIGLEHLTALEKLVLWRCKKLDLLEGDNNMPWNSFKSSLRSLQFKMIPKMVRLPRGVQCLTTLIGLEISFCDELTELSECISGLQSLKNLVLCCCPKLSSLPEGMRQLTALNHLQITECPGLKKVCQRGIGLDWPKIQHIPYVSFFELNRD